MLALFGLCEANRHIYRIRSHVDRGQIGSCMEVEMQYLWLTNWSFPNFEDASDDSDILDKFWNWLVLPCAQYIRRNAPVRKNLPIYNWPFLELTHFSRCRLTGSITALAVMQFQKKLYQSYYRAHGQKMVEEKTPGLYLTRYIVYSLDNDRSKEEYNAMATY